MKGKRFAILTPLFLMCLSSCRGVEHDISEYVLEMQYKENFKILQLSDVHLANKDDQQRQFDFLDLTINEANADLIIFTGDTFTFADKATANRFFKWIDGHNTPWTMTFGNHDEQTYFPVDWLTGRLNELTESDDSHCIFKDIQDDNVFGNANFAINLVDDHGLIQKQVIVMDSNRYCFGDYYGYDQFHEDQVEWYSDLVDYTTNQAGRVVESYAFFHIPLPEMEVAYNLVQEEKETGVDNPDVEVFRNQKDSVTEEGVSCPKIGIEGDQLFETMLAKGSTKAIFNGHDHVDDYAINYKGIIMCYGVNSTDRIYFDEGLCGGQTITIHPDGSIELIEYWHSYEEVDK